MPGFSRISLGSVSCLYSPNRQNGPLASMWTWLHITGLLKHGNKYGIGMTKPETVLLLFGFTVAHNLGQSSSNLCTCIFSIGPQTWKSW